VDTKAKKSPKPAKVGIQKTSTSLQGWPGYRTREGRSGLDPVDSNAESGHMVGIFIQRLLGGNLRTKKPLFLVSMAVIGLGCISPILLAVSEALQGNVLPFSAWAAMAIPGLVGSALLVSFIKNLIRY
jgi:hypothetical protein